MEFHAQDTRTTFNKLEVSPLSMKGEKTKKHVFIFALSAMLFVSCGGPKAKQTKHVTQENKPVELANEGDTLCYPSEFIPVDRNEVRVYVSEDEKMRCYTWNTYMGGTCPDYAVKCQYRTSDGNVRIVDMGNKDWEIYPSVHSVHSVQKNDGPTIYLIERYFRTSSTAGESWIDAYMIDQDSLKAVNVCGDDNMSSNYSIADWYYRTNEGWDWLYEYDAEAKNMYVPETAGEFYPPDLTDRYTVYHFNGDKFVPKRDQPHRGLHQSLCDYQNLELFFHTQKHIVRIDKLSSGELRYASWKSPATFSDKPDLVIVGGQYNPDTEVYTFANKNFTYLCGVGENIPTDREGIMEHHEYLIIKEGNKVIGKEERILGNF